MHKDIDHDPALSGSGGSFPDDKVSPEAADRVVRMREQMKAERLRLGLTEAEYLRHMSESLRKGRQV